ncbi:MAG TPA: hypothetical protein VNQ57_10120 [Ureibacillus sp.]|nr:hypothetical protein [Ureibacillus sp.]
MGGEDNYFNATSDETALRDQHCDDPAAHFAQMVVKEAEHCDDSKAKSAQMVLHKLERGIVKSITMSRSITRYKTPCS